MQYRKIEFGKNSWLSIAVAILFLVGLFMIAKTIFWLLWKFSWILLIATAIIDYTVITGFGKWIVDLTKRNWTYGIFAGITSVLLYPILFGFLLIKALFKRKVKTAQEEFRRRQEGNFIDYEEVDSQPTMRIELPPKQKQTRTDDTYDNLFGE